MDMDQNNLFTNENSAVKPIIQKKSPATALAFISLILVVALLITFFITVRDLNKRYDELSETYRQTLENQTDNEQEQTPDISIEPEDMERIAEDIAGARKYFIQQYRKIAADSPPPHLPSEVERAADIARRLLGHCEIRGL